MALILNPSRTVVKYFYNLTFFKMAKKKLINHLKLILQQNKTYVT